MTNHLARRGGIWWTRLVVPQPLREAVGRREFTQSTRTHELHIAKLVAATLLAGWRQKLLQIGTNQMSADVLKLIESATALIAGGTLPITQAAESIGLSREQLLRVATSGGLMLFARLPSTAGYILPFKELQQEYRASDGSGGIEVPAPQQMPTSAEPTEMRGTLAVTVVDVVALSNAILADGLSEVHIVLFDVPNRPGFVFAPDTMPLIKVEALEVDASQVIALQSRLASKLTGEQIQRAKEHSAASNKVAGGGAGKKAAQLFSAALEAYATDTNGIPGTLTSETEQDQKKRGCALFIELMGDMPLGNVSSDILRKFRLKLKDLPGNANHIPKAYQRETMAATSQAMVDGGLTWPKMSEGAQLDRMQWVNQMFRWLLIKEDLNVNPMAAVLVENTKTAAERKAESQAKALLKANGEDDDSDNRTPFTSDELRLIFSQVQYETGNGSLVEGDESSWYPFEYWLPIIALHSGCRIKEVSQLYLSEIRQSDDGVLYFDINETTRDKSLKNASATRQIPVSPVLIDLGLIAYRDRLKAAGYRRLFPELTYSRSDARYAKESKRRMSAMFKGLGMPRDGTKVFHCLRANFNDAMLRVRFSELPFDDNDLKHYIRLTVVGHKIEGVNLSHYASTSMVEKLALVKGLRYDFPPVAKFDIEFAIPRILFALSKKIGYRKGRDAHRAGRSLGYRVTLVDTTGLVVGDAEFSPEARRRLENHATRPEVVAARRDGTGSARRRSASAGDEELYVAIRHTLGFVRVSITTRRLDEIVDGAQRDVLVSGLLALVGALALAWLFARSLSQPVVELRDVARARSPAVTSPGGHRSRRRARSATSPRRCTGWPSIPACGRLCI